MHAHDHMEQAGQGGGLGKIRMHVILRCGSFVFSSYFVVCVFGHQGQPPTRVRIVAETFGLPFSGFNVLGLGLWLAQRAVEGR